MNTRMGSWLALPFTLFLSGCPDGGGGGGGFEGVPLALQAYLKASNTDASDNFGRKVAIDGDTLVIGVPDEDSNAVGIGGDEADDTAADSGAVYVFIRSGGIWSQQAYIKASNTETGDGFGTSVAISGDTLVVGATGEDSSGTGVNPIAPAPSQSDNSALGSGAVYVFTRAAGVWSQQAYVKTSNAGAADTFGSSVAISGDTLVVGAPGEDGHLLIGGTSLPPDNTATGDSASASGAVYVFTRAGTTWTQQAYVKASNTGASDAFGTSVAISGNTLVVGATGEDSNFTGVTAVPPDNAATGDAASNSGAVYVFTRSVTTWTQQAYVKASNTGAGDAFGTNVAISGDTLAVGAPQENGSGTGVNPASDNSAAGSGAAYVFTRNVTTWTQQAYVKASNTGPNDGFGTSVAISGSLLSVGAQVKIAVSQRCYKDRPMTGRPVTARIMPGQSMYLSITEEDGRSKPM